MGDLVPFDGDNKCGAKKKDGVLCKMPAGYGTDHHGFGKCKWHGGCTPSGNKAGKRKQAADAVLRLGLPREVDPQVALLEEVWRCAGNVAFLESIVQELGFDPKDPNLQWGGARDIVLSNRFGEMVPSIWIQLYQQERRDMVKASSEAIRCGVAERAVQLAEHQAGLVAAAFQALIEDKDMALTAKQRAKAPAAMNRALSAVAERAS